MSAPHRLNRCVIGGYSSPKVLTIAQTLKDTSRGGAQAIAHAYSPYDSAKLLVNFHLKVEVKSYMPGAVRGILGWVWVCGWLGVWMARIEERSNASPEPRSAM